MYVIVNLDADATRPMFWGYGKFHPAVGGVYKVYARKPTALANRLTNRGYRVAIVARDAAVSEAWS